jgi:fatty acid CoA ligase FadD22
MIENDLHRDNFVEQLFREAHRRGGLTRPAFVTDGTTYTFSDVYEGVEQAAAVLAAHAVEAGDSVLLILPDGIDLVRIFLGAAWLGAVPIIANYELHAAELERGAEIARPKVVIGMPGITVTTNRPMIPLDEFKTRRRGERPPAAAPCGPETPAYALLTSGTTGGPRLCVHTHQDPYAIHASFGDGLLRLTERDVSYSVSRMYFSYGLCNSVFYPQFSGTASFLTPTRPSPLAALATIRDFGVTVFYAQPSFYARLLAEPHHEVLDRLRLAIVGGELLSPSLEAGLRELLGERLINVIGATEVGNVFACASPGAARPGWIGPPVPPYRMRVVNEREESIGTGAEGRLQVLGSTVTFGIGHFGESVNHGTGSWWPTGDTAVIAEDGFVRVLGRADDMEIIGGVNVHPAEIEDFLVEHPRVLEAAVCAIRKNAEPTRLRAYIVAAAGVDTVALGDELRTEARQRLTWYKVPDEVAFIAELPRTPTGKLNRRLLRELANGTATASEVVSA